MPIERIKPEPFPAADRIEALKELFPEAFADGAIDWATLRELASSIPSEDEEETAEHFGLFWPGKREARRLAGKPAEGTLIPCPGEGIDEDKTSNVFIEGENLEVLKLLRKSYKGMVKMIYIDPPYNTGNDFVYDDNFTEPLEDYLRRTGQIDGEGRPLTTNKKSDGRFHSKWLSMMYPRLRLARDLLRDDGVIFVSIDDNEVQHIRMLMNEIFGENSFLCQFPRITKKSGKSTDTIAKNNDYLLCYSNSNNPLLFPFEHTDEEFKFKDEYFETRGLYKLNQTLDYDTLGYIKTLDYEIKIDGISYFPGSVTREDWERRKIENPKDGYRWRWSEKLFKFGMENGFIVVKNSKNGSRIYTKTYQLASIDSDNGSYSIILEERTKALPSIEFVNNEYSNDNGKKDAERILGKNIFSYPKPVKLLKTISKFSTNNDDIIIDFFAGSATTAHAVLDLNKEDSGHRKFILVQMPEATPADSEASKAGYTTIAEIGKERIRRVIKKIKTEKAQELSAEDKAPDLGFKVFKLARSNFKPWKDYHGDDIAAVESLFENAVTPLASGWKDHPDALFTEILLLEGYPLDSAVKAREEFGANTIREVSCPQHEKRLLVCLDEAISPETVRALELRSDEIFVCLDSAIDDSTKARLDDKGMIKTI